MHAHIYNLIKIAVVPCQKILKKNNFNVSGIRWEKLIFTYILFVLSQSFGFYTRTSFHSLICSNALHTYNPFIAGVVSSNMYVYGNSWRMK